MKRLFMIFMLVIGLSTNPLTSFAEDSSSSSIFSGAIILSVGSPNAIYDNTDQIIDEDNFNVVPFVKNGRTLVPLRFVSESLEANVVWNGKTSTATITSTGKVINITPGRSVLLINNKNYPLDAAAEYKEGRIFVPLRAISEAFGKEVFFDRGIIVISNTSYDQDIINYLRFVLAPFKKDPYTGKTLNTEQIANLEQSVVLLESFDREGKSIGFGTAFAVGYGLFLTNYHVISEASQYLIETVQDRFYDVDGIVAVNKADDLALVKTKIRTNIPPLRIGSTWNLAKGQSIVTIGNPEGFQNTMSTGIISGLRTIDNERYIQITAPITNGSSGGPLFNIKGEVIGINTMGEDKGNLNFAVPIDYASAWIAKYKAMNFSSIKVLNQDLFRENKTVDEAPATQDGTTVQSPSQSEQSQAQSPTQL
ncbi:trypsin-like peptidase domain-containing protein [Paenibacillus sediminis]|uniref:S1-C subfamily serine protease n=1 Tax=Paenibacillus sediminis TaxID=664909 RepID=A0ABS4H4D5_9BACL|nr:trypsin-like peptidase domain-containing protein [Paenibacillus sediminis]MBP1937331.1 S1-C subfamily serine protease [Paenibacillus sediminis]